MVYIQQEREIKDSIDLINKIKEDGWITSNTLIINCFPHYSSSLSQIINHKLSYLNKDYLYDKIDLEIPFPNFSQVLSDGKPQEFGNYLNDWVRLNIDKRNKYLLVLSNVHSELIINRIRNFLNIKLEPDDYRICSLYSRSYFVRHPDYYVSALNEDPVFWWQNSNNPDWKIKTK